MTPSSTVPDSLTRPIQRMPLERELGRMSPDQLEDYRKSMTAYYEELPAAEQPENWKEERLERDAIQWADAEDFKNRSVFTRGTD